MPQFNRGRNKKEEITAVPHCTSWQQIRYVRLKHGIHFFANILDHLLKIPYEKKCGNIAGPWTLTPQPAETPTAAATGGGGVFFFLPGPGGTHLPFQSAPAFFTGYKTAGASSLAALGAEVRNGASVTTRIARRPWRVLRTEISCLYQSRDLVSLGRHLRE
jgi:hypothetical protein